MNQRFGLALNRLDHIGMAMPGGNHGNPGSEIEKDIPIDVLDQHSAAVLRNHRIITHVGGRDEAMIQLDNLAGLGTRQWRLNLRQTVCHKCHKKECSFPAAGINAGAAMDELEEY